MQIKSRNNQREIVLIKSSNLAHSLESHQFLFLVNYLEEISPKRLISVFSKIPLRYQMFSCLYVSYFFDVSFLVFGLFIILLVLFGPHLSMKCLLQKRLLRGSA